MRYPAPILMKFGRRYHHWPTDQWGRRLLQSTDNPSKTEWDLNRIGPPPECQEMIYRYRQVVSCQYSCFYLCLEEEEEVYCLSQNNITFVTMNDAVHSSLDNYEDTESDMRRWMIPIVGFFALMIFSIISGVLASRGARSFTFLKYLLLFHVLLQLVTNVPSRVSFFNWIHWHHSLLSCLQSWYSQRCTGNGLYNLDWQLCLDSLLQ